MAGRFGKYGDLKRRKALQRSHKEKARLAKSSSMNRRNRRRIIPSTHTSLHPTDEKTYKTAVVVIPPDDLWVPIQALRKQYDRHFRRWMPHITLLYPFRPPAAFDQIAPLLAQACLSFKPFEVQLARFDLFAQSRRNATIYLIPEPATSLKVLHKTLLEIVPDCDDVARYAGGFTPHLSVGQVRSQEAQPLCSGWQATWQPLAFTLTDVYLIWRNDPPDDVFRKGSVLSLGGQYVCL